MTSSRRPGRWLPLVPAGLLVVIASADALRAHLDAALDQVGGLAVVGALDEPAHVATAALVLLAARSWRWLLAHRRVAVLVLLAAVLIDLDHVLLYAGVPGVAADGRPFSHSPATALGVLGMSLVLPRSWRLGGVAVAVGILLHLVRDVATGPGVPLGWPLTEVSTLLPYPVYAGAVLALTGLATARAAAAAGQRGQRPGVGRGRVS